jgi:hypothetical protein
MTIWWLKLSSTGTRCIIYTTQAILSKHTQTRHKRKQIRAELYIQNMDKRVKRPNSAAYMSDKR